MSLYIEYMGRIEREYGHVVAQRFINANAAIDTVGLSDDQHEAYHVRVDEITALVDAVNASGGVPGRKLTVERSSPQSIRVNLRGPYGLDWRCYVFQDDFMFYFAQALASSLPVA